MNYIKLIEAIIGAAFLGAYCALKDKGYSVFLLTFGVYLLSRCANS